MGSSSTTAVARDSCCEQSHDVARDIEDEGETFGFVHSMDSFTAVDGAGIRCIVFLQGCRKRCAFCCNVDSTDAALISTPKGVRPGTRTRVRDVLDGVLRKNLDYYVASGGGLTLSGGECLLQPAFVKALCVGAKALGVTTALDTAAAGTPEEWAMVLPHVDMVLLCVKSAFVDRFIAITGTSHKEFELSRRFLKECDARGVVTWIRFVLMTNPSGDERFEPFVTDSEEELRELARLAKSHRCVRGIELLPYHRLGVFKFQELGLTYKLEGMSTPSREEIARAKRILNEQGVDVMC